MRQKNLGQTAGSALIHMDIRLQREHSTMFRHKLFGNAAAAILGLAAVLGTNAANAQINLDTDTMGLTYAMETVLSTDALDVDGAKYYEVGTDNGSDDAVVVMVGVASTSTSDRVLVQFDLTGLVFRKALTSGSLTVGGTVEDESVSLLGGGDAKSNTALFSVTGASYDKITPITLAADYNIGTAGMGTITMTATNVDLASLLGADNPAVMNTASYSGAIKLGKALKETVAPTNPLTTVDSSFQMFAAIPPGTATTSVATVGSFTVGLVDSPPLDADTGIAVPDLAAIVADKDVVTSSYVKFMGDFSFASKVTLDAAANCEQAGMTDTIDLRDVEGEGDDLVILDTTDPTAVGAFDSAMYLCITVDSDDEDLRIPATGKYMAMTMYKGIENAAMPPPPGEGDLGMIERDGTTVHLPYLTTNAKWNQRIYIVNRGPAAEYFMEFNGADDVAGSMATGTLLAKSTTVMMASDVVTVGEGGSTSGTLTVETQQRYVDVATNQVHRKTVRPTRWCTRPNKRGSRPAAPAAANREEGLRPLFSFLG